MDFSGLPVEIRQIIWVLSIPDDEPEVCLLWPAVLHERYEGQRAVEFTQPLLVDTGWPTAMHVCRESRAVMRNENVSGLRFRHSSAAGCAVPYRAFRPELDTLYWGGESFEATAVGDRATLARTLARMPALESVESLALELRWGIVAPGTFAAYRQLYLPKLRTIALVLAGSSSSTEVDCRMAFRQPARRCKLRKIAPEAAAQIMVRDGWEPDRRAFEPAVPLFPVGINIATAFLGINDKRIGQLTEHQFPAYGSEPAVVVSGYEPKVMAQTFVEYQPDRTWKEICLERTFVELGEMVRSGPYVPYDLRPDPTQERVNDIDGSFDVVYDSGTPDAHAFDW